MADDDECGAETYWYLAHAYLDMDLTDDALVTIRAGLAKYPNDAALTKLLDDRRLDGKS